MKIPFFGKSRRANGSGDNGAPLLKTEENDYLFFEQFKAFRAKFEHMVEKTKVKTVAVTSSIAGEGKTTTCANLSFNLASGGRRKVLLVDADLRKSDLAKGFDLTPLPGLSEYLAGSVDVKDVLRGGGIPGFYIIPGGRRVASPSDLIAGSRFRDLLKQLRDDFDIILLDTPPVLPVSDAIQMAGFVDGFLLLYRLGVTPHPMLRQAAEELGEKNILGVVLNGVEPRRQKYYQKYYGKYYRKPGTGPPPQ